MDLVTLISIVVIGALVGWIASKVKSINTQTSVNIVVGIIGAYMGKYSESALGLGGLGGLSLLDFLFEIAGAVILIFIVALIWAQIAKNLPKPDQEIQSSLSPKIQQEVEKQSLPKASTKKVSSGTIFLSYRRADSQDIAGRVYDRLVPAFGKVSIFKDVDSIPLGTDFKKFLGEQVSQCDVLLAVIGDTWLEARDEKGNRRLEDPRDFVRIEIESALERDIPVIPLLVRGASMPSEEELPASLKELAFRNGTAIRPDPDFHRDMDRLIAALKAYVKPKRSTFR